MKKIFDFLSKTKNFMIVFVILEIICVIIAGVIVEPVLEFEVKTYPEKEYQTLETEIARMVETRDYESEYEYTIENCIEEKVRVIKIYGENEAVVTGKIKKQDSKDELVSLERNFENRQMFQSREEDIERHTKILRIILKVIFGSLWAVILSVAIITMTVIYDVYCVNYKNKNKEENDN